MKNPKHTKACSDAWLLVKNLVEDDDTRDLFAEFYAAEKKCPCRKVVRLLNKK